MEQAGAYVRLIEYDNIQAFLLYSEVSRQRIKSVKKYISVGKCEMMDVRRVDVKTKSVDLSRKSIKPEDRLEAMERFKKAKKVHAIMRVTAVALKTNALKLYEEWGWDLYDKFDHAYDAFRIALAEPEQIFPKIEISKEHQEALLKVIESKIPLQPKKIRADFKLTCTSIGGIDLIK
jgi:translation initiation factor 2 subunit 1